MSRVRTGLSLAVAAALVSGVAVYVNGRAVRHFPSPTVYTTAKNLIAGAVLVAVWAAWARRGADAPGAEQSDSELTLATHLKLGAIAIIGGAVPFVLFFEGLGRATSNDAAFIHKTLIIWAAVLAVVILRERVRPAHLVAIALLVAGHAALAGGVSSLTRAGAGELMILAATLCWSVEVILVKQVATDVGSPAIAAARLGGGSILLVGWVAVNGNAGDLTGLSGSQWMWIAVTAPILATFVTLWFAALERAQVIDVTAILVLGAVVTGLINIVVGNGLDVSAAIGDALILIGVVVIVASAMKRTADRGERLVRVA